MSGRSSARVPRARPTGDVRTSVSVSETQPTPRCSNNWSVPSGIATGRPDQSGRQIYTALIFRRCAASSSFSWATHFAAPESTFLDLHSHRPPSPYGAFRRGPLWHGKCLLIPRREATAEASTRHFWSFFPLAEDPAGFCVLGGPSSSRFRVSSSSWAMMIVSSQTGTSYSTPELERAPRVWRIWY